MKFETHLRKVCFEWNFSSENFENVLRFFGQNVSFRSLFIFWTSSNLSFLTQKFRTQCQFRIEIKWSENSKVKVQMWRRIDFGIRWQLEFVLFFFSVEILNSKFLFLFSIIQWNYEFSFGNFWKKRFNNPVFIRLLFDLLTQVTTHN